MFHPVEKSLLYYLLYLMDKFMAEFLLEFRVGGVLKEVGCNKEQVGEGPRVTPLIPSKHLKFRLLEMAFPVRLEDSFGDCIISTYLRTKNIV